MKLKLFLLILVSVLGTACKKKELMPAPVGKAIPYRDSTLSIDTYLSKDSQYSIFMRAWRRSSMTDLLRAYGENYQFSLFLPNNTAMEAAGYDEDWARWSTKLSIDSVLRIHVSPQQIDPEQFTSLIGRIPIESLFPILSSRNLNKNKGYLFYLTIDEEKIKLNSKIAGNRKNITVIKQGTVFPIDFVLKQPKKDTRRILYEDGRFSIFIALRRHNDSLYNAILGNPTHVTNPNTYDNRYILSAAFFNEVRPVLDFLSIENYWYMPHTKTIEIIDYGQYYTTVLAPTNEAFKLAGFGSLNDLIALNKRSIPTILKGTTLSGYLPTDSILNNHYWGTHPVRIPNPIQNTSNPTLEYVTTSWEPLTPSVIFSDDLRNDLISERSFAQSGFGSTLLKNPLEFIREGRTIKVRVKGSNAEPSTIVERDIETFNGVIHVLDRLLIPKGFKLH